MVVLVGVGGNRKEGKEGFCELTGKEVWIVEGMQTTWRIFCFSREPRRRSL